ncbi:GNAT family N-acetyltransferase [uncultured Desulfovibrio sp.]|uniref:GNAT family N-acetyltransferase n=3 Tax=uncultured Desulfovibrio sp. TaxID=167968 RepID=UPI00263910F3|nr:GNAT family N-acetyltransferase [uncultured Desulfovibrio sp.]
MNILFLGPECPRLEYCLVRHGHSVHREEGAIAGTFVRKAGFDFGLSYRYQHILRQDVIDFFSGRLINLHIALLPWNRGSDPNLWSFLEDTPKGVTIHRIDAGVDTGDILLQEEMRFDEAVDTLRTTYAALSRRIEQLFWENAPELLANAIPARKQRGAGTSHRSRDKTPYLYLLEKAWWDTPVRELPGKAKRQSSGGREKPTLVPVTPDNKEFLFHIINDEQVRSMSFESGPVDWETHCRWFAERMEEKNPFYLGMFQNEPCGYVRFQARRGRWERTCRDAVISVALHSRFRGKGLATPLLRAACHHVLQTTSIRRIHACVKAENSASLATFRRCHFSEVSTEMIHGNASVTFLYPGYGE